MLSIITLFQNLSIRIKLLVGFGLVLVILLFISALSYQSLQGLSARFEMVTKVSETNLLISEARQQEKNFLLRNDRKYYQAAQELSNKAKQLGETSLALFTTAESASLMRELLSQLDAYQRLLSELAAIDMQNNKEAALVVEEKMTVAARAADYCLCAGCTDDWHAGSFCDHQPGGHPNPSGGAGGRKNCWR